MKKILAVLVASLFAAGAYAQATKSTTPDAKVGGDAKMPEAQKPGSEKAEAKAQMKSDSKGKMAGAADSKSGADKKMPEAQKPGSEKAEAKAEMKTDAKAKGMSASAEGKSGADKKMPEAQMKGSEKGEAKKP